MQLFQIKSNSTYYIYAPSALIGSGLEVENNVLLEIKNGLIASLNTAPPGYLPLRVRNDHNFFSLDHDLTLMPCLIDAHVHLALDGKDFQSALSLWDNRQALQKKIDLDLQAIV